jgi:hypothetical protein
MRSSTIVSLPLDLEILAHRYSASRFGPVLYLTIWVYTLAKISKHPCKNARDKVCTCLGYLGHPLIIQFSHI